MTESYPIIPFDSLRLDDERVLLVGGAGFIGHHLALECRAKGAEVMVMDNLQVNNLVKVEGTPLDQTEELDPLEFVRTIAVARILMPQARVRLSAGREEMSDEMQTLCFIAGANSIFYGEDLLTTGNATPEHDLALFERLKIKVSG